MPRRVYDIGRFRVALIHSPVTATRFAGVYRRGDDVINTSPLCSAAVTVVTHTPGNARSCEFRFVSPPFGRPLLRRGRPSSLPS